MSWRILIIEPTPADARWLTLALEECGIEYDAVLFPSAVAALAALPDCDTRYDVVLLNYHLPFLDVTDAMSRLQELRATKDATFAITIALEVERGMLPADSVAVMKPVDAAQLRPLFEPERCVAEARTTLQASSSDP